MEPKESIKEAVVREYFEETGLRLISPELKGVYTMVEMSKDSILTEWMMFTFICDIFDGSLVDFCDEGELEWVAIADVLDKPMAPSDRYIHQQLLNNTKLVYGTFEYEEDYQIVEHRLD